MDVYERCLQHGRWVQITPSTKFWCGWAPLKGREHYMTWADPKTKQRRPWLLSTAPLGRRGVQLGLLEFSGEVLKDMLDRLRRGRASVPWEVTDVADDVYWKHMDAEWRRPILDARTGRTKYLWVKRSSRWPDHLRDCEVMQIAGALFYRALDFGTNNEQVDHAKGTEGTAGSEQADVGSQP
jgi:hypothetical protein